MKRPSSKPRKPDTLHLQDTVRLSADGLAKVLGDLEARVMRAVWALGKPASARSLFEHVSRHHDVVLLTVITVLNNLVDKGLLKRAKRENLFHYEACWSQEEFIALVSRRVVAGVLSLGPDAVAASFVDVLADEDPDMLAELGRRIRRRLREKGRE